jgi:predicted amidophosphoribosyltransferase
MLNVKGAFSLQGEELKEKEVLLVDDVNTTGATLDSCARVLKTGGSRKVWGLTVACEV